MWYDPPSPGLEEEVIGTVTLQRRARQLDASTLQTLRQVYGDDLEGMLQAFGYETELAEQFLQELIRLRLPRDRRIILQRFGLVTGTPASVRELAAEHHLPEAYIRETDMAFLKLRERIHRDRG